MPMPSSLRSILLAAAALALAACSAPQGPRGARAPDAGVAGAGAGTAGERGAGAPSAPGPTSRRGGYYMDDGPGDTPPPDLAAIPDAVPRYEPLLPRTARPYSVFGRQYTPMAQLVPYRERGMASWYGRRYHGQPTSSGERYDMYAMTAAHPTLPIPSYARVTHVGSGRSVIVRVNDRGPFLQNRIIDLSYTAAAKLGYVEAGSAEVEVELFTNFDQPMLAGAGAASTNAARMVPVVYTPGGSAAPGGAASGGAARAGVLLAANAQAESPAGGVQGAGAGAGAVQSSPSPSPNSVGAPAAASSSAAEAPVRLTVETIYAPGEPPRSETRPEPERYDAGLAPAGAPPAASSAPAVPAAGPSVAVPSSAAPGAAAPPIATPSAAAPPIATPSASIATPPVKAPAAGSSVASPASAPRVGDGAARASAASVSTPPPSSASLPAAAARSAPGAATKPSATGAAAARGYWLQLGAFATLENAQVAREQFARRLDWLQAGFDVRQDGALFKVQAGPWARREQAQAAAERIRAATELQPFMATR